MVTNFSQCSSGNGHYGSYTMDRSTPCLSSSVFWNTRRGWPPWVISQASVIARFPKSLTNGRDWLSFISSPRSKSPFENGAHREEVKDNSTEKKFTWASGSSHAWNQPSLGFSFIRANKCSLFFVVFVVACNRKSPNWYWSFHCLGSSSMEKDLSRTREGHELLHLPSLPGPALTPQPVLGLLFGLTAVPTLLTPRGFGSKTTIVCLFLKVQSK